PAPEVCMALVIVQARLGSTRLPGKILRPLGGRSVLAWVVRAALASGVGEVVVATTDLTDDDATEKLAGRLGVDCVRGEAADVLSRFVRAVQGRPDRTVVRITADCPLLDPAIVRMAVAAFEAGAVDYVSTDLPRSLPRGLDVEALSR